VLWSDVISEATMKSTMADISGLAFSKEVREFAAVSGIDKYLESVVDLAQQAFPGSEVSVSVGQDAEDQSHRYVALDVQVGELTTEELLASQHTWSSGLGKICPPRHAVAFVLGWR
jgi:hypothetical protein